MIPIKDSKATKIKRAATKLFLKQGYKQTSVADLAKAADSSQVTIYKYFGSKQNLAHQVVLDLVTDGYDKFQKFVDDDSLSFPELAKKMIFESHSETENMNLDFADFLMKDLQGQFGSDEAMQVYQHGKVKFWEGVITRGRRDGFIKPEISNQAVMTYLDMFIQYYSNAKANGNPGPTANGYLPISEEMTQLFFYGLMGKQPKNS
ncbi:TetR/AcrR family transcriptional regulator [Lentilactobacillus sp. Marseille-Q4993]|uniref:TetR/AcrR family transcriptional regulator n=1 Tax=Lentilactobacillus sp. Marseille-Q4993 TaxID=3039492 RepID=UPI0024BCBEDB|nr:TetR/AcrR family transcriptional regulator [Lentilactobacillus sp. Marseille-Q4993]